MAISPNTLFDEAKCYLCLGVSQEAALQLALLARIASAALIQPDGAVLKHQRVSTGSVTGNSSTLVTVTWTTPFADANYTVSASVLDSTNSTSSLSVFHVESQTAQQVTVRIRNQNPVGIIGTLEVIAIHD